MAEESPEPGDGDRGDKPKGVCVICGRPRDPQYAPFCSRRCADIDLYRWLKGGYVIADNQPPDPEGEDEGDA